MSALSPQEVYIATLECRGMNGTTIRGMTKISAVKLRKLREKPEYIDEIEHLTADIRQQMLNKTNDLVDLFNLEAYEAFKTVKNLNIGGDSDAVRLSAAKTILDRAPDAPKERKEAQIDTNVSVYVSMGQLGLIKDTLTEVGDKETLELLEGEFEVLDAE